VVTPDLEFTWRDEAEFDSHVALGFYTRELAEAVRAEGQSTIDAITRGDHPCLNAWAQWLPDRRWEVPAMPPAWADTATTSWARRHWAYGPAS
jgi:hypothetical protein